jgi:hypothetical protein
MTGVQFANPMGIAASLLWLWSRCGVQANVCREINRLERAQRSLARFSGQWERIYSLSVAAIAQTWLRRIP